MDSARQFSQDATMTRTLACRQRERDEVVLRNALRHGGDGLLGDRKGRGFSVAEDKDWSETSPHHEDMTKQTFTEVNFEKVLKDH